MVLFFPPPGVYFGFVGNVLPFLFSDLNWFRYYTTATYAERSVACIAYKINTGSY